MPERSIGDSDESAIFSPSLLCTRTLFGRVVWIEQPRQRTTCCQQQRGPFPGSQISLRAPFPFLTASGASGGPVFHLSSGGEEGGFWTDAFFGRGSEHWDPATPRPLGLPGDFHVRHSPSRNGQTSSLPRLPRSERSWLWGSNTSKVADTSTRGALLPSCGVVGTYYAKCASPICCWLLHFCPCCTAKLLSRMASPAMTMNENCALRRAKIFHREPL